ncbi:hypothetical protein NS506_05527 [Nocardia seriolae]|uniref:Uncharacterized protein n=1 Tax=Nocardia seriolae TaxID=37332 RepID=A0ABC8AZD9_9NOCA|nr:hypothetical protein NS506_05527 [Nocardia seriolae]
MGPSAADCGAGASGARFKVEDVEEALVFVDGVMEVGSVRLGA